MPEGSILCMMLALLLSAVAGVVIYCLRLCRKYQKIEADMQCVYAGAVHKVDQIVFDRNDWFLRKVRFHTTTYPYVVEVLISEVDTI